MKYYFKFLGPDRQPCHGGSGQWPLPGEWTVPINNPVPCKRGYHLCRKQDLLSWCNAPTLWIVEVDPVGILIEPDKVVVRSARLVRQVEEWNEKNQRLFAADCAENVLKNFESVYPNDPRPRQAIETARKFALGSAPQAELDAAWSAAESAAWSARSTAWSTAYSAAYSAAKSAAKSAAESAAWSAAWSAESAESAEFERTWQTNHLLTNYLNLNPEDFA